MRLPNMKYKERIQKTVQTKFAGLDRSVGAKDGTIHNMLNMTGDHYPVLATRERRHTVGQLETPGGMIARESLAWVDGTDFYYDSEIKGTLSSGNKTMACMGDYIVIFPDKKCYNTATGVFCTMEAEYTGTVSFGDGLYFGEAAKANAITVAANVDFSEIFQNGDGVTISGCTLHPENNKDVIIREIAGNKLYFYENAFTLPDDQGYTEQGTVTIRRAVPDLDYICQHDNRLWGCHGDDIYASKQRDLFNWNYFDGSASDAYWVDTGSPGAFTGCISYGGYPMFFKEDRIFRIYGTKPTDYQVMGSATMGVAEGSSRSLTVAGEVLFYLSRAGVMAYSGGVPQSVSEALYPERLQCGIGGSDGMKYYLSAKTDAGDNTLLVYDTRTGLWHREDDLRAVDFASAGGVLYVLAQNGAILAVNGSQGEEEDRFPFAVEFSDFTADTSDKKGTVRLQIRMELAEGASAGVWLEYDSNGIREKIGRIGRTDKRSFYLSVTPHRCDHFKLVIDGYGDCKIHSVTRAYCAGGEY